jgi:hypothetical protein
MGEQLAPLPSPFYLFFLSEYVVASGKSAVNEFVFLQKFLLA